MSSSEFFLERRQFLQRWPGLALLALVAALAAFAVAGGRARVASLQISQETFAAAVEEERAEWRKAAEEIERTGKTASPYDAQPMDIRIPAVLPPAPLAVLAAGSGDLHPTAAVIAANRSSAELFSEYEVANPALLAAGRFDLAFLIAVLFPLLMIAASFDALAADRASGRARLAAAQGGSLARALWGRLAIRHGALFLMLTVATAGAVAATGGLAPDSWARLALFLGAAGVYAAFWHGLIGLVAAAVRRSETAAAALAALWLVLTFAAPAVLGAAAAGLYPPPSRLALLSEMRATKAEAARDQERLTKDYFADHPDLFVSDEALPAYYTNVFLANRQIEARTAPIAGAFEEARQKRQAFVGRLQYLSPPLIAERVLTAIAGADTERALSNQAQTRAALAALTETLEPVIVSRRRLPIGAYDALPGFAFAEAPVAAVAARIAVPLGFLLIFAFVLYLGANRALRGPLERTL
jgi:ABC-2 type transport system permease protein